MTNAQQLLLNFVDCPRRQSLYGKHGLSSVLGNAQDDIPATPVIDVVRERAQGMENLFWIPSLLVLDSRPFHLAVVHEIVNVYGQRHYNNFRLTSHACQSGCGCRWRRWRLSRTRCTCWRLDHGGACAWASGCTWHHRPCYRNICTSYSCS